MHTSLKIPRRSSRIVLSGAGILWLLLVGVQYDTYLFSYPYLTKMSLGYPQRHLLVKNHEKK